MSKIKLEQIVSSFSLSVFVDAPEGADGPAYIGTVNEDKTKFTPIKASTDGILYLAFADSRDIEKDSTNG